MITNLSQQKWVTPIERIQKTHRNVPIYLCSFPLSYFCRLVASLHNVAFNRKKLHALPESSGKQLLKVNQLLYWRLALKWPELKGIQLKSPQPALKRSKSKILRGFGIFDRKGVTHKKDEPEKSYFTIICSYLEKLLYLTNQCQCEQCLNGNNDLNSLVLIRIFTQKHT